MTGDQSPHVDATVVFNGRLQPNKCTWMKFQDSAMVLEEQPAKVAEAVKLFLQGLGHTLAKRRASSSSKTGESIRPAAAVASATTTTVQQQQQSPPPVCQTDILVEGLDDLKVASAN